MPQDQQLPVTSSTEPGWDTEEREFYRQVLLILHNADVPFAVGGAFAIHKHTGIWRSTKDLDLLLVSSAIPDALEGLRRAGFNAWIEDPIWLAKVSRGGYLVDLITGMGNAGLFVEQTWLARSIPDSIFGVACSVLRAEELIASKLFVTRRERFDGADIVHLLRKCGANLDWDRLLQILHPHWELLYWSLVLFAYVYPAHTSLVPERIWSGLTQRFTNHISHPQKDDPFRGSLIDPYMFAIDVNEWGERDLYREYAKRHFKMLQLHQLTTENKA
jgi:hypothetical protein